MELPFLTAAELRQRLDRREISAVEAARACLNRIAALDSKIQAFVTVCEEDALVAAEAAQKAIDENDAGPLTGIPVVVKDNFITKGIRTTCSSKILADYVPPYDGTVSAKLRQSGAVVLGKTNMDEFAMGTSTEFSAFFPTKNPWDLERVPGGSSGGSAAAVAAGFAPIAFGSDTGGSVRQPASLCGVVGFKPTYGRVSRYGLVAFSSSLDQIGPMALTVADVIAAFETIHGADPMDSTTMMAPYDLQRARQKQLSGLRFGVPKEMFSEAIMPDVRAIIDSALGRISNAGGEIEEFSASMVEHGISTYYIIAPAEASSNLARYDGVRYGLRTPSDSHIEMMKHTRATGFGKEVLERIIIGTYVLSSGYYEAYYTKAHQARTLMRNQFRDAFQKYDVIVCPTSPTTAFRIGELTDDPLALKLADYCTIPANMGGFPALSLNAGFAGGLPVGIQLIADNYAEDVLFSTALGLEEILEIEPRRAPI